VYHEGDKRNLCKEGVFMKKIIFVLLTILLLAALSLALADGQQRVTQKNFYVTGSGSYQSGYFFAKIENVGDMPIYLDSGKLVIFDLDDNIAETSDYIRAYPSYLEPGEYAYTRSWSYNSIDADVVGDVKFSIGMTRMYNTATRLACEAVYDPGDPASKYDDYIYATYTNTSEETLFDVQLVFALLDAEDNLLYVTQESQRNMGIHPGSTVTMRASIDSDFVEYFTKNKIEPVKVDVLVYYEIEN